MCTLNVNAPIFTPTQHIAQAIYNGGAQSCVRLLLIDSDEYREEFLFNNFNREAVADEDL